MTESQKVPQLSKLTLKELQVLTLLCMCEFRDRRGCSFEKLGKDAAAFEKRNRMKIRNLETFRCENNV